MARGTKKYSTRLYQKISEPLKDVRHVRKIRPVAVPGVGGAPPIYDPVRFPHIGQKLCQEYGFTTPQLARVFGVSTRTVDSWMIKHEEFKKAVQAGKDEFDGVRVESALLKIALGYEYEEKSVRNIYVRGVDSEGNKIRVPAKEVTINTKTITPNAKAIMFWLTNRQPARWKMVTTVNATINAKTEHRERVVNVYPTDISNMNSEQLRLLRDMIAVSTQKTEPLQIESDNMKNEPIDDWLMDQAREIIDAELVDNI